MKPSNYTEIKFERLHTLEFTSDRKRMSTIIRDPNGQIWLYTKGAESHVFPLCLTTPSQISLRKTTQKHIDDFAKLGLRTLAMARRELTNSEFQQFCTGEFDFSFSSRIPSKFIISLLIHFRYYKCKQCIGQS